MKRITARQAATDVDAERSRERVYLCLIDEHAETPEMSQGQRVDAENLGEVRVVDARPPFAERLEPRNRDSGRRPSTLLPKLPVLSMLPVIFQSTQETSGTSIGSRSGQLQNEDRHHDTAGTE